MKSYFFFLIIGIVFLASCQPRGKEGFVNLNKTGEPSALDFFSDIHVVQLETNEKILLGIISKVVHFNNRFYILDGLTQQFFCFVGHGKFVYKISARGKGPGEYNYITDFSIDPVGKQIFVLDPIVQRVLLFNLEGEHTETFSIHTEKAMGFNKVFALNDSIIILTSITNHQLVYYNTRQLSVVKKVFEFPLDGPLDAFSPRHNVYQYHGRTFVLPYLGNDIYDVSAINFAQHFRWDFGPTNNSNEQIERLISKIGSRQIDITFCHDEVGKGKILNHHIVKVYETSRYKIAMLEFDNYFRHVFWDKKNRSTMYLTILKKK